MNDEMMDNAAVKQKKKKKNNKDGFNIKVKS